MKQIMKYRGENTLCYSEFGDGDGYPILVQHGLIASISDDHLFEHLSKAGKRIICIARPGYGESSSYRMKNVAEWGAIVGILVDALQIAHFDVLGISSGAPYSYAIGYVLPTKARNIYIFSGTPALYEDRVLEFWPYPIKRNASIAEMANVAKKCFFRMSPKKTYREPISETR